MKKIVKTKKILLERLNLAEYVNLMERILGLTQNTGAEALGIEPEVMARMASLMEKLQDMLRRSFAHMETVQLLELKEQREKLAGSIINAVFYTQKLAGSGVIEPHLTRAAQQLWPVLQPCSGLDRLPTMQSTTVIDAMLFDLNKEENLAHVATLGLTDHVAQLQQTNSTYHELTQQRTEARIQTAALGSSTPVRREMDRLYDYITTVAFCRSVTLPSEQTASFMDMLNAIATETKTAYNRRMAQRKSGTKTADGSRAEKIALPDAEEDNSVSIH